MNVIKVVDDFMYPYSNLSTIPKGQVEFSKIRFMFSDSWSGKNKIAQFDQKGHLYNQPIVDEICSVPVELELGSFDLYVKGYGLDGEPQIATANGLVLTVVQGGKEGGTPPVPPTPDLYAQLLEAFSNGQVVRQIVEEALTEAKESGDFTGPKGDLGAIKYVVVTELPEHDTENAIYLLPVAESAEGNLFDEYIFVDGAWEKIGSTSVAVNLDEYVKKTDYATAVKPGIVMVPSSNGYFGLSLIKDQVKYPGGVKIQMATHDEIDARTQVSKPIVPNNLDYAIKKGLTANTEEWTEEDKQAARTLVGAVGSSDYGSQAKAGLCKGSVGYGTYIGSGGVILIQSATPDEILNKNTSYKPIVPSRLDYAIKVSLTTNKETLTDEERAAALKWLGVTEQIGDIETSLDGIIAIQNSLIGGDEG